MSRYKVPSNGAIEYGLRHVKGLLRQLESHVAYFSSHILLSSRLITHDVCKCAAWPLANLHGEVARAGIRGYPAEEETRMGLVMMSEPRTHRETCLSEQYIFFSFVIWPTQNDAGDGRDPVSFPAEPGSCRHPTIKVERSWLIWFRQRGCSHLIKSGSEGGPLFFVWNCNARRFSIMEVKVPRRVNVRRR